MPKFEIAFEREVTAHDQFTRVIEADTEEAAQEIADAAAPDFNNNCPDDAAPTDYLNLGDWGVESVKEVADDTEIDEF